MSPLVTADALALELGVSRAYVYEHSAELGVFKLGNGPRARLRFDPELARASLSGHREPPPETPAPRRRAVRREDTGSVLTIRPRRPKRQVTQ